MKTITIITYTTGIDEQLNEGWDVIPHGGWLVLNDFRSHNKRYIPAYMVVAVEVREVAA